MFSTQRIFTLIIVIAAIYVSRTFAVIGTDVKPDAEKAEETEQEEGAVGKALVVRCKAIPKVQNGERELVFLSLNSFAIVFNHFKVRPSSL